jgi:hypothetical protein
MMVVHSRGSEGLSSPENGSSAAMATDKRSLFGQLPRPAAQRCGGRVANRRRRARPPSRPVPPGKVPLLARRVQIRVQHRVDHRSKRIKPWCGLRWCLARRQDRARQRLAHRAAMHAMLVRKLPDRQPPPSASRLITTNSSAPNPRSGALS